MNRGLFRFPRARVLNDDALGGPIHTAIGHDFGRPTGVEPIGVTRISTDSFGTAISRFPPVTDYDSWYDLSDASTVTTVSSAISQLNDKGPAGFNLTQATAANRPLYGSSFINGYLVADYDGNTDFLSNASFPFFTRPATYMNAVLLKSVATTERRLWDATSTNIWILSVTGTNTIGEVKAGGTSATMDISPLPLLEPCFICYRFDASSHVVFNVNTYSQQKSDNQTAAGSGLALGARSNGSSGVNMFMLETLYWDRELSNAEVELMRAYLAKKWAMPDVRVSDVRS